MIIPSGEGDCGSFERTALLLSAEFTVLTFDMPGFSRSGEPPDFSNYSMSRAAAEIAGLSRALRFGPATSLRLQRRRSYCLMPGCRTFRTGQDVVVHEVALGIRDATNPLTTLADDELIGSL